MYAKGNLSHVAAPAVDRPERRTMRSAITGRCPLAMVVLLLVAGTACSGGRPKADGQVSTDPAAMVMPDALTLSGTVWVTNRAHHDVTAFDARTSAPIATIPVGRNPIGVVVVPRDGGKVYVSNEDSDTVSVIAKRSQTLLGHIPIPTAGAKPHHMAQSPDGRFVYVAEFGSHFVAVIDTSTDAVISEYDAGPVGARTHAVAVSPDGRTLYAVNSGTNDIVAIDAQTGARQWALEVGRNPSEILVAPGGRIAYVSIRGEDLVKVVDLSARTIFGEIRIGTEPDTLQLTEDGRILVVALRGTPAYLALAQTRDFSEVRWVELDGRTTGHHWLSANGRYTFVAVEDESGGSVGLVNNRTGEVVDQYPYPAPDGSSVPARPHGVFHDTSPLTDGAG